MAVAYRMSLSVAAREYVPTAYRLRFALLTVASVLALVHLRSTPLLGWMLP